MPVFNIGDSIESDQPTIIIENDPANPLPPGAHIFQLVVTDDSGNQSAPAQKKVVVRDTQRPTAVIDGPSQVEAGVAFELSGAQSSDVPPGRIVSYKWTRLD
jgi:hypothetical protein